MLNSFMDIIDYDGFDELEDYEKNGKLNGKTRRSPFNIRNHLRPEKNLFNFNQTIGELNLGLSFEDDTTPFKTDKQDFACVGAALDTGLDFEDDLA